MKTFREMTESAADEVKKRHPLGSRFKTIKGHRGASYIVIGHNGTKVVDEEGAEHYYAHIKRDWARESMDEEHKQAARVRASHNAMKKEVGVWSPRGNPEHRVQAQHAFGKGRTVIAAFMKAYKNGMLSTAAGSDFPHESERAAKSTAARNSFRGRTHLPKTKAPAARADDSMYSKYKTTAHGYEATLTPAEIKKRAGR